MTNNAIAPITRSRELSNSLEIGTGIFSFLVTGEDTGGAFSLIEVTQRPGGEPPYHVHELEDETVHVLEGRIDFMVDGTVHEVSAGGTMFLPRGIPHTFRVKSAIARSLLYVTPAGFENYFRSIGTPAQSLDPAPDSRRMDDYYEVVGKAAARHKIRLAPDQPIF